MVTLEVEWNWYIILLSYTTAVLGCYTSFHIIFHVNKLTNKFARQLWTLISAFVMGACGMACTHFVGMLSATIPDAEVRYDMALIVVALLVSICASRLGFGFMLQTPSPRGDNILTDLECGKKDYVGLLQQQKHREKHLPPHPCASFQTRWTLWQHFIVKISRIMRFELLVAGFLLSVGMCSLHYFAMRAMRVSVTMEWSWGLVVLSCLVALTMFTFSLWIHSYFHFYGQRVAAAFAMGVAVCAFHYTGMAAVTYTTDEASTSWTGLTLNQNFAVTLSLLSTLTCFIFLGAISGNVSQLMYKLEEEVQAYKNSDRPQQSAFVATVSHELRTPLNIIVGATELMSLTAMSKEQQEYAGVIEKTSQQLSSIINDILDFSKLDTGRVQLEYKSFSLVEVTECAMTMLGLTVVEQVDLVLQVAPDLPERVFGDSAKYQQVLVHILSNAVKFTQNGYILVDIRSEPSGSNQPCNYVISVEDSGIGISAAVFDKLFEPFQQGDSTHTRKYGGTGISHSCSLPFLP